MLEKLFFNTIEITLYTSVIILLLMVFSKVTDKRYGAGWRYFIWLLLAIRMLIPMNITLPKAPVTISTPPQTVTYHAIQNMPVHTTAVPQQAAPATAAPAAMPVLSLYEILAILWLTGIVLFLLWHSIQYLLYYKRIQRSRMVADDNIKQAFHSLKDNMGISREIGLFYSNETHSPMLMGLIKPMIILPVVKLTDQQAQLVLKHELIHYKRHDLYYKLVLLLANAVHWFNPLVYCMVHGANQDLEVMCDNAVVKDTSVAYRQTYAAAMLEIMKQGLQRKPALTTHFLGGKKAMKQRFKNLFDDTVKKRGKAVLCTILILTIAGGIFVGCSNENTAIIGGADGPTAIYISKDIETLLKTLYDNRTEYVGNQSKVAAILDHLPFGEGLVRDSLELQTDQQPYGITGFFQFTGQTLNPNDLFLNACIVFSLVDNADKLQFTVDDQTFAYTRIQADQCIGEGYLGKDIREYNASFAKFKELYSFLSELDQTELRKVKIREALPAVKQLSSQPGTNLSGAINGNISVNGFDLEQAAKERGIDAKAFYGKNLYFDIYQTEASPLSSTLPNESPYIFVFYETELLAFQDLQDTNTADMVIKYLKETLIQTEPSYDRTDLDASVGAAVLAQNSNGYLSGECVAEGHIILDTKVTEDVTTAYCLTMYGQYGFEDGVFTKVSGTGVIPVVVEFQKDSNGVYSLQSYTEPQDGAEYTSSIETMFPKNLQRIAINGGTDKQQEELKKMEAAYAAAYLKQIGREAKISQNWALESNRGTTDMDTEASNQLLDTYGDYPYWIGTQERIENGVRYVYEKKWDSKGNGDGIVTYVKYSYDTKEVVEETQIEVKSGKIVYMKGTPRKQDYAKYN